MEHLLERIKLNHKILFNVLIVVWGSCLLTAAGAVSFSLPFSPVPIALQVTMVVLMGVMLGPKRGVAAVILWLAEASFGLPVLSGGRGGMLCFVGPTAGYLLSYPFTALIAGLIAYRKPTGVRLGLAFLVGSVSVYPGGLFHLSHFVGWSRVWALGLFPFLAGDFVKSLVLATIWKKLTARFLPDDA